VSAAIEDRLRHRHCFQPKDISMTNLKLTLLAAAAIGAVSIGGASAMPFSKAPAAIGDSHVQDIRVVCDDNGRCYNTRRTYRRSYSYGPGYAPGYYNNGGYYARPAYGYNDGPRLGIGVGPIGLGIW
jgi:hypothetical protein